MKLSVLIITYNEEKHIGRCLESVVPIADEIIVVDSYSTDKTAEICEQFDLKFVLRAYPGQIEQKNYALSLASHDYILAIDGDEALSGDLMQCIAAEKLKGFPEAGYSFNRLSFYCGKWIRHGDWYPDWKLRLWNKHKAQWGGTNPHDKVSLHSPLKPKKLKGNLLHYTFETKKEHLEQVQKYALTGAQSYFERRVKFPLPRMVLSPLVYFFKNFLLKGGFLDGAPGLQITLLSMKEKYLKYHTLYTIQRQHKERQD